MGQEEKGCLKDVVGIVSVGEHLTRGSQYHGTVAVHLDRESGLGSPITCGNELPDEILIRKVADDADQAKRIERIKHEVACVLRILTEQRLGASGE